MKSLKSLMFAVAAVSLMIGFSVLAARIPISTAVFWADYKYPVNQIRFDCNAGTSTVAVWLFNEESGNLTEECGTVGDLTANGNPTYEHTSDVDVPEGIGKAITFDGTGDWFQEATNSGVLDVASGEELVVEAWFRTEGTGNYSIISTRDAAKTGFILGVRPDDAGQARMVVTTPGPATCLAESSESVDDGEWHYLRGTWPVDNDDCHIQVDGGTEGVDDGVAGAVAATDNITVGDSATTVDELDGDIAMVRVCIGASAITDCPSLYNDGTRELVNDTAPTFTRATTSTAIQGGQVVDVASGDPVITAPIGDGETLNSTIPGPYGLYVGAATTFELLDNEDFTTGNWASVGSPTVTTGLTDPGGGTGAVSVEDDATGSIERQQQDVTITDDSTSWTYTVWAKCDVPHSFITQVRFQDGTATENLNTETCTREWTRFENTHANNGTGNTTLRTQMYVTENTASQTGKITFWRPQLYNKDHAVPLDPAVAGSAVTVNKDTVSYSAPSDFSTGLFSCASWGYTYENGSDRNMLTLTPGSGTTIHLRMASSGGVRMTFAAVADVTFGAVPAVGWNHYAFVLDDSANTIDAYVNGSTSGTQQATPSYTSGMGGTLAPGGINAPDGLISREYCYDIALTSNDITALYDTYSTIYAKAPNPTPGEVMFATVGGSLLRYLIWGPKRDEQFREFQQSRVKRLEDHRVFFLDDKGKARTHKRRLVREQWR